MSANLKTRARNYRKQHSLGQNFLIDEKILDQIIVSSDLSANDLVVEIGPGIGFLTERIVDKVAHLYSVELDAGTVKYLQLLKLNNKNFDFLRDDFLALSIEDILGLRSFAQKMKDMDPDYVANVEEMIDDERLAIGQNFLKEIKSGDRKIKIVANIPYQITTKILLHLLGDIGEESENKKYISEINILVQKEFADRLVAKPGTKDFSSITHLISYWAEVERTVEVPAQSFMPAPKVDSTFIKIKLRDKPLIDAKQPTQIRRFIKAIFSNRRKKLRNGLKAAGYQDEEIEKLALSENLRGETLGLQEIAAFVEKLS